MSVNWKTCNLGEIADVGSGSPAPQKKSLFQNGSHPFVRTSDVGKIRFGSISDSVDKLNKQGISGLRLVLRGSVLLPKSGASTFLNHRVILDRDSYVSSHLATVKARKDKALDRYLLYFLLTVKAQDIIQDHKYPSLKLADIKNLEIQLPPLAEQKRIVAILDEAFAGIATAVANTEKNLANARELFESYLNSVFSVTPPDWVQCKLSDICSIKHGFAFKSQYFSSKGRHVVLTPGSFFESGGFRDQGQKTKYYKGDIPEGYILNEGDFLVAMTEQAAGLLGSSLTVPEADRYLHNQRLGLVKVRDGFGWHNEFFFHQFNTRFFRDAVQSTASGVKVRHTSPIKLGAIIVKHPPTKAEQESVASRLDQLLVESRRLGDVLGQKLTALAELKQSLLQKAFSGELTANDREVPIPLLKEEAVA